MRHALVRLGVPDLPEIEALMIASPALAIESVLDGPDAHGGAPAYLPIPPTPAQLSPAREASQALDG